MLNYFKGFYSEDLLHLEPTVTGQTECSVRKSGLPSSKILYQIKALPFWGLTEMRISGKTVEPPCATSLACRKNEIKAEHKV